VRPVKKSLRFYTVFSLFRTENCGLFCFFFTFFFPPRQDTIITGHIEAVIIQLFSRYFSVIIESFYRYYTVILAFISQQGSFHWDPSKYVPTSFTK
jgi:hypothetical protein